MNDENNNINNELQKLSFLLTCRENNFMRIYCKYNGVRIIIKDVLNFNSKPKAVKYLLCNNNCLIKLYSLIKYLYGLNERVNLLMNKKNLEWQSNIKIRVFIEEENEDVLFKGINEIFERFNIFLFSSISITKYNKVLNRKFYDKMVYLLKNMGVDEKYLIEGDLENNYKLSALGVIGLIGDFNTFISVLNSVNEYIEKGLADGCEISVFEPPCDNIECKKLNLLEVLNIRGELEENEEDKRKICLAFEFLNLFIKSTYKNSWVLN